MDAIVIKGLKKSFKSVVAVDGLDLTIQEGELFSLLGENGAGKSTTVKILCGLTRADEGEIQILGEDAIRCADKIKGKISLSPQETAVANHLTVLENLEFIAELYGMQGEAKTTAINTVIEKLKLGEKLKQKAKTLSGGMQRRLSIAMALVTSPQILFLDEPTLGLDVMARRELWKIITEMKNQTTIILTTHYMEEAEALSDRVGIMVKGKLCAIGSVKEMLESTSTDSLENAFIKITENYYE